MYSHLLVQQAVHGACSCQGAGKHLEFYAQHIFSLSPSMCTIHWEVSTCIFFVYWHAFWCTWMQISNAFLNRGFEVKRGNSHWPRLSKHFAKHQSAYYLDCHWLLWASQCNKMQKNKMSYFLKCTVLQCKEGNRLYFFIGKLDTCFLTCCYICIKR